MFATVVVPSNRLAKLTCAGGRSRNQVGRPVGHRKPRGVFRLRGAAVSVVPLRLIGVPVADPRCPAGTAGTGEVGNENAASLGRNSG